MNVHGRDTTILFDLMTHSTLSCVSCSSITCLQCNLIRICSDSGVGDHGPNGIEAFITQHRCNYVCKGLNLARLSPENATEAESTDDEDGNNIKEAVEA